MTTPQQNPPTPALPTRHAQLHHLKKLALRILLPLLLLAILFCYTLDYIVKTQLIAQTPTHGAAKLSRIQESRPTEIPIIGSSRALCSYIPDTLGPEYYNYGINGIGFAVMDIFLQQELAQQGKTTPIILNFDYAMFYYQMGDLNSYLPHSEIPEVKTLLKRHDFYSLHMRIPGIRYFGSIDAFAKDRLNEKLQLNKAINKGAAIEKAVTPPPAFAKLVQQRRDTTEQFSPRPELIDTLLKRIQDHPNRQFIITMAPYHQSYYESIPQDHHARANQLFQTLKAFPNARVIRFDTQDWPDSLFFNTTHVSLLGAQKMSQMLRDSLTPKKP
jgi:hypothetical protein